MFGMNVNLLEQNPGWQWYIVIAGPILAVVLSVWIFCKYLPVCSLVMLLIAALYMLTLF